MLIEALSAFVAVLMFYLVRFKLRSNYWSSLGVKQPATNPFPIGNNPVTCFDRLVGKINIGDAAYKQYLEYEGERMYGTYKLPICRPVLMLRDTELIRDIFIKDFGHFVDRNRPFFGHDGPTHTDLAWQRQMSSAHGEDWKELRTMFSPIFTSGKLKTMLHLINAVSKDIENHFAEKVKEDGKVELKEVFGKFSMDAIASSAFGIEAGSFKCEEGSETEFVKHAKTIFMLSIRDGIRFIVDKIPILGSLVNWLGVPFFSAEQSAFFYNSIVHAIRHRQETGTRRNDLIDLMIEAMTSDLSHELESNEHASDQFEKDAMLQEKKKRKRFGQDINELDIVATAMAMLTAGYDTTAQTLIYIGYELAKQPDIQKRLQDEIDTALEGHEEESLDYRTVQQLPYLDMVINEALRLYAPAGLISRACTRDYRIKGTNVTIKKGQEVQIPILGIHRDPQYYPYPLTFNPENFSKENKANRSPYTFLAFGQGPRSCIGMRFALLEVKVCLVHILSKFSFVACDETPIHLTRDPASNFGQPLESVIVKVVQRKEQITN